MLITIEMMDVIEKQSGFYVKPGMAIIQPLMRDALLAVSVPDGENEDVDYEDWE